MKDEIKEILEDVKRHLDYVEATKQCSIRDNEMKAMYDYITDLQDTIQNKNECIIAYDEIIKNRDEEITNLQEENKHIFANVNDDQLLRSNAMNYAELQDYKTRNEEATEYIKNKTKNEVNFDNDKLIDVLNILQGKSD